MRPVSLPIKSFLIRKLAVNTMIPERDLEVVINHQFTSALDAMSNNNSVEISGFGKFLFNMTRANKAMDKFLSQKEIYEKLLEKEDLSEAKRKSTEARLKSAEDNIRTLKPKLR
jgi:nucleoid DNA-binding protein